MRRTITSLLLVCLVIGCSNQTSPAPPAASVAKIQLPSGATFEFRSDQPGTLSNTGNRLDVVRKREFSIEGEVANLAVGDVVFIDLYRPVKGGKLSSCANASAKVESVSDGKARFKADFYTTELPEEVYTLRFEGLPKDSAARIKLADVDCRLSIDK